MRVRVLKHSCIIPIYQFGSPPPYECVDNLIKSQVVYGSSSVTSVCVLLATLHKQKIVKIRYNKVKCLIFDKAYNIIYQESISE